MCLTTKKFWTIIKNNFESLYSILFYPVDRLEWSRKSYHTTISLSFIITSHIKPFYHCNRLNKTLTANHYDAPPPPRPKPNPSKCSKLAPGVTDPWPISVHFCRDTLGLLEVFKGFGLHCLYYQVLSLWVERVKVPRSWHCTVCRICILKSLNSFRDSILILHTVKYMGKFWLHIASWERKQ